MYVDQLPGPQATGPMHGRLRTQLEESQTVDGTVDIGKLCALVQAAYEEAEGKQASLTQTIAVMQAEMETAEHRFHDIAGAGADWFWETDKDYRLTYVSERIGMVLGLKPIAVLGHDYFTLGLDEHDPVLAARHRQNIADRESFRDVQFRVGPETGPDAKVVRISGVPVYDSEGEFVGHRGVGVDVTREAAAEQNAILARQHLVDALESIADGIALFDAEDRLVLSNTNYRSLVPAAIHPGMTYVDILLSSNTALNLPRTEREAWVRMRMRLHREATGEANYFPLIRGQWILGREYRTRDGGTVAVRTNITELIEREHELDELRRRYELILDFAGAGIFGLGDDGRISFANRMACTILNYHASELINRPILSLFATDAPNISFLREAGLQKAQLSLFLRKDETTAQIEYQVAPIVEAGAAAGAVMVFHDVALRLQYERVVKHQSQELERLVIERTAEMQRENDIRVRTETALRASRERLKSITDSLFEAVVVVNRNGDIAFANSSARKMLEIEDQEVEGLPLDHLLHLTENGDPIPFERTRLAKIWSDRAIIRDDDAGVVISGGKTLEVAYACSAVIEDGECRNAVISFRAIDQLKQAQREAFQASRLATVGQLAAGIAHEINTPVQYIGNNLRFIGDSLQTLLAACQKPGGLGVPENNIDFLIEELPISVQESLDGVAQIARIVLSMKEFSHPGTQHKTLTDINRALETTLTVSATVWRHSAKIVRNFDPDLPAIVCHVGELNQVFLNLIVNAAQAIETSGKPLPGTITITTTVTGDCIEITVADTGTGVPAALREKNLRPLLHDQGSRQRHRTRAGHLPRRRDGETRRKLDGRR